MLAHELGDVCWRKSSYSGVAGDCVEVALLEGGLAVRDSKDPQGPALVFSSAAWEAFIAEAKKGSLAGI